MDIRTGLLAAVLLTVGLSNAGAQIPSGTGWHTLPNTKIASVCPSPTQYPQLQGNMGCAAVTGAWNSAVFDSTRNRMIVWGGGHNDYLGNELYALNLNAAPITMTRINNPSPIVPTCGNGNTGDSPPQAASRHTYDHIVYMSHIDRMFVFGGASSPCGFMLQDTWTFNFATMTWQKMNPTGPAPEGNYGRATAYDPSTRKVYIADQTTLYTYTFETNAYAAVTDHPIIIGQEMTGIMDTTRHHFIMVGNGAVRAYDMTSANPVMQTWNTTGATAMISRSNPGVAYDPTSDRIVAWDGGNTVYSLNPTTKVWTSVTNTGGPAAMSNGTFKRFAYSPASQAFVTVNSVDADASAFRMSAATPPVVNAAPAAPRGFALR